LASEDGGPGKHQGVVDGIKYFDCEFHVNHPLFAEGKAKVCGFLRHSKTTIGGIACDKAIHD